jgi:hypothetical protein
MEMYIFCCFFIFIFSLSLSCLQRELGEQKHVDLALMSFLSFTRLVKVRLSTAWPT